jgi:sialidase-1
MKLNVCHFLKRLIIASLFLSISEVSFCQKDNSGKVLNAGGKSLDSRSYVNTRGGLANCYLKFTNTRKGRVAFMGGSITHNPGWRDSVCMYLQSRFPLTIFEFINAGVSSTGSTPGAFRLKRDVLDRGEIDLLFEEAAVNDRTNMFDSVSCVRGMEGIVAHARQFNPYIDIVLMYFADPDKIKDYNAGIPPYEIRAHNKVAAHYNIPSLNLAKEVTDRINNGEFSWENDFKDLHPSPFGQSLYFHSIKALLEECWEKAKSVSVRTHYKLPDPIDLLSYFSGDYIDVDKASLRNGWVKIRDWSPQNNAIVHHMVRHISVITSDSPNSEAMLKFSGKAIGMCVITGPDAGTINYSIDGKYSGSVDLFTPWSNQYNIPWYVVLKDNLPDSRHILQIQISDKKNPDSKGHACYLYKFFVNR